MPGRATAEHVEFPCRHFLKVVDAIAERTNVSKRMIYCYFTSKEQLYLAVLEKLYGNIRATEAALKLDQLDPEAALRRMVEFTFEHHDSNVDFIRLVSIENIHHAEHLAQSQVVRSSKSPTSSTAAWSPASSASASSRATCTC